MDISDPINHRFSRESMRDYASELYARTGVLAVKFAVAALVLDQSDNILVCYHAPRDGESEEDAAGSVTETLRYLRSDRMQTETPLEALMRCLKEEHDIGIEKLEATEIVFVRSDPAFFGEWPVGVLDGVVSTYPSVNVLLRTHNPSAFIKDDRPSEEITGAEFMNIEVILANDGPKRPGYNHWLKTMISRLESFDREVSQQIIWPTAYAKTAGDARVPY